MTVFDNNYKFWLGGFADGEGSLTISIVKHDKAPYGILLQPEFNVTQHINGISILNSFKILFNNKGQIHQKSGSSYVWVYSLKGINNLINHLIPYFLEFVVENLLIDLETKYLSFFDLNSLYNFKSIASSMLGYKHTEEAKSKMRILNKGKNHPLLYLLYI